MSDEKNQQRPQHPTGGGRYEVDLPDGGQLTVIRHDGDNSTVTIRQPNGDTVRLGALPVVLPYLEVNGAPVPIQMSREEINEFNRFISGVTADGLEPFEGLQIVARVGNIAMKSEEHAR